VKEVGRLRNTITNICCDATSKCPCALSTTYSHFCFLFQLPHSISFSSRGHLLPCRSNLFRS
jgi:hypothetical protein